MSEESERGSAPSRKARAVRDAGKHSGSRSRYRLIAELGHGGMGVVYLAVARGPAGFNKLQVVKRLQPTLATDRDAVAMFLDEARLAARLNHPHVVQTNEVGADDDNYFIAMEYLDGQSLEAIVRRARSRGRIPQAMHLRILADVLAGLHYAHELRDFDGQPLAVVHRDVSPHNVFVTYDGGVKLVDFGIAKTTLKESRTDTGVVRGKSAYLSPEQVKGEPVDRRADIFAVGVVLWQALTGEKLWRGLTDLTIYHKLAHESVPAPRTLVADLDPRLDAICVRALASDPSNRYATAEEMQIAIEEYLRALGGAPGSREIGALVSELFAESRSEIRNVIEAQLRDLESSGDDDDLEVPPLTVLLRRSQALLAMTPSASNARIDVRASARPTGDSGPTGSRALAVTPGHTGKQSLTRHAPMAALIVGGALLGGVAVVAIERTPPAPAPSAAIATGARMTLPAIAASTIAEPQISASASSTAAIADIWSTVTLSALPANAKITLDDAEVATNPFTLRARRDGALHHVTVQAVGYAPQTRAIVFSEATVTLSLTLNRAVVSPPAPSASARPHGLDVDPSDPWKR